jgi:hypothetical protein
MIRPWTWTHTSSPCQGFAFEGLGKACWRWKRFFGNQLHCKLLNFFVQVGVGVLGSNFSELYCVCTNASFNGDQLLVWVFAAVCKRIPEVPTFRSVKWTASTQLQACVVHTLFADGGHVVWGQNCPLVVLLSRLLMLRALQMIQWIHFFEYQLFECCPKSVLWFSIWCILFVNLMFFCIIFALAFCV